MRSRLCAFLIGISFCCAPALADEGLTASGSIRARYEALTGQFRPLLSDDDHLLSLRTILTAEYDFGPVRIGGELRDSRIYDPGPTSPAGTGEVNALEPVQAYVGFDLDDALGEGSLLAVDVGRFVLDLGSRRLSADDGYRNTTNGFTGIRAHWLGQGKQEATFFLTMPQVRLPSDRESIFDNEVELDRESTSLLFWGGIVTLPDVAGGAALDLYFYGFDEDDSETRVTRDRELYTSGLRLWRAPKAGAWDFELEAAYQFGETRTSVLPAALRRDVSAGFVHAAAGYTFAVPWAPRLSLDFDYASGDRPGGSYNRFDNLFGSRSGDFGATGIYGAYGRANIVSPAVKLQAKPSDRLEFLAHYRPAWLASETDSFASTGVRDAAGASGRFAANQFEVRARYWIVPKRLRLETGGAVLLNGRFLEDAPNAAGNGDTVYGYSSIEVSF